MPELKSVIAGLAISTALTGGVVGLGATTTAAEAASPVYTGKTILNDDGFGDDSFGDDGFGDVVDFGDSGRRNRRDGFGFGGFGGGGFGGHRCHRGGGWGRGNNKDFCVNVTNDNFNDTFDDRRDFRRDDRREHDKFKFKDHERRDDKRVVKPHHDQ
ncbi:hypothetical protein ACFLIM_12745 [Nonomuraea sp. M3C6]|uniref:Uncharacterized protein n=1 Tax=Nonomuraea marmarensis TaxID=3351344 RepID=A0ABW7AAD0_9ACTN